MTTEEKKLLLKDLCTRLPYGVKVYGNFRYGYGEEIIEDVRVTTLDFECLDWLMNGIEVKPYLRPMSSMTKEEKVYLSQRHFYEGASAYANVYIAAEVVDWMTEHHLDFRGLIEKGLALEAPEGMYEK